MRSDPRKRRSGQTRGLYFVVKSGDGAPRDNQPRPFLFECSSRRSRPIVLEESAPGRPAGAVDGSTTAVVGVTTAAAAHARHTPRARVGARPPLTNTAGARSAAAPTRRPAPATPLRARVGVPAEATVAPVRLLVICTGRDARRPATPAAVARDMEWSEAPPPSPAPTRRQR